MKTILLLCIAAALFAACSKGASSAASGSAGQSAAASSAGAVQNPLLVPLQEAAAKGGKRAFVRIPVEVFNGLKPEDYAPFFKSLEGKNYNYVTIFVDGSEEGVVYIPKIGNATNGILDKEGAIIAEPAEPFTLVYDDKTGEVVSLAD